MFNMDNVSAFKKKLILTPQHKKICGHRSKRNQKQSFDSKVNEEENQKLHVSVKVRPSSGNVLDKDCITKYSDNEIHVKNYTLRDGNKNYLVFSYDNIFWCNESTQCTVFETIAIPLLEYSLEGFNTCLFAYGQTGSGKTYSLMDADGEFTEEGMGIIPRFCKELLCRQNKEKQFSMSVSYYEIYNEKIYDLLRGEKSVDNKISLKVREHPLDGPYVSNLTLHPVETFEEILQLLIRGNKLKMHGATLTNERSSRSHTIYDITLTMATGTHSKIRLVDLAGSERVSQCTVTEERFREGLSINKSLLTLGKVITALADEKKKLHIPYRESLLTWLLKDCLGGSSKTCMLATVSPSMSAYEETLSTLRWANKAKSIICTAVKNEDPEIRLIVELQNEVKRLKSIRDNISNKDSVVGLEYQSNADLELRQKSVEIRLQNELAKLEMHLDLAEKEKSEIESQRDMLLREALENVVPSYKSNFYESLKNILNSSINDSVMDTEEYSADTGSLSVSSTSQLKEKYLNKIIHLARCLKSIYQTEICLNPNDSNITPNIAFNLIADIEEKIYKIIDLNSQ